MIAEGILIALLICVIVVHVVAWVRREKDDVEEGRR